MNSVMQVLRSEAGRIDPTTGVWQLNEGKGSRHVRYVLRVSALGRPTVEVRRRWRHLIFFLGPIFDKLPPRFVSHWW